MSSVCPQLFCFEGKSNLIRQLLATPHTEFAKSNNKDPRHGNSTDLVGEKVARRVLYGNQRGTTIS